MLAEIEEAIVQRLADKGLDSRLTTGKNRRAAAVPMTFVSIESGKFEKVGQTRFWQDVTVYVTVEFKNARSEKGRRKGLYPVLEGIVGILALQDMGLPINHLRPEGFSNVTDIDDAQAGLIVFQVTFGTGFYIQKQDDEVVTDLLRVGLDYYLQDPSDDGVEDAADEINLEGGS